MEEGLIDALAADDSEVNCLEDARVQVRVRVANDHARNIKVEDLTNAEVAGEEMVASQAAALSPASPKAEAAEVETFASERMVGDLLDVPVAAEDSEDAFQVAVRNQLAVVQAVRENVSSSEVEGQTGARKAAEEEMEIFQGAVPNLVALAKFARK